MALTTCYIFLHALHAVFLFCPLKSFSFPSWSFALSPYFLMPVPPLRLASVGLYGIGNYCVLSSNLLDTLQVEPNPCKVVHTNNHAQMGCLPVTDDHLKQNKPTQYDTLHTIEAISMTSAYTHNMGAECIVAKITALMCDWKIMWCGVTWTFNIRCVMYDWRSWSQG